MSARRQQSDFEGPLLYCVWGGLWHLYDVGDGKLAVACTCHEIMIHEKVTIICISY